MEKWLKRFPGIGFCLLIALPSWFLVELVEPLEVVGAPVLAILIGMLVALFVPSNEKLSSGVAFTSKKILQAAVVLLGFGLNLATVGKIGATSLPVIVATIATSLIIAFALHKLLKIPSKTSTLIGVGSSICGGSAIAATAPVIGADDEEIAQAISVIFLFNVIAAILFPNLGTALGLSNESFGLFAGTAINDTSSVTAAASTWDSMYHTGGTVLEYATIVKLTRTLAIIPITLVLSIVRMRKERKESGAQADGSFRLKNVLPMFVIYFVLASLVSTILGSVLQNEALAAVNSIFSFLKTLSKFFIVMAMAAIGLNTNLVKLVKNGGKPIVLGFCCWVSIGCVSLLLQSLLGL